MNSQPRRLDVLDVLTNALRADASDEAREVLLMVESFAAGRQPSLEVAFGLASEIGQRSTKSRETFLHRDRLVVELARDHFAGLSVRNMAEQIAKVLLRFHLSHDWKKNRTAKTSPFPAGMKDKMWLIFKQIDHPLGAESLRKLLGNQLGLSITHQPEDDLSQRFAKPNLEGI